MTERTKIWHVEDCGQADYLDGIQSQYTVRTNTGSIIGYFFDEDEAAKAVKAVNNHDKLVEALKGMIVDIELADHLGDIYWDKARALLKTLTD